VRNAIHVVASLVVWCLFGYYWYLVSKTQINRSSLEALVILSAIVVVGLVLTLLWVAHNRKLARRNRRTTPPSTVPETFDFDYLGRTLDRPEVGQLKTAQIIDIEVVDDPDGKSSSDQVPGRKVYAVASQEVR
jgi:hypothetical protein